MDGRRRLVEPVTDGAPTRPAAGTAPETWRVRARRCIPVDLKFVGDIKLVRTLRRRWAGQTWRLPRGAGIAAALTLIVASAGYGAVRGGHLPVVMAELQVTREDIGRAWDRQVGVRPPAGDSS